MFNDFLISLCRLVLIFLTAHIVIDIDTFSGVGKHFLRSAKSKSLLQPRPHMLYL